LITGPSQFSFFVGSPMAMALVFSTSLSVNSFATFLST
jgi:hypothetical protein